MTEHEQSWRAIDAHFAGKASPQTEGQMRAHLPTCAPCKHRYRRHLLLAALDPGAPPREQRLARGLDLRAAGRTPGRNVRLWLAGALLPVAAAIAIVMLPTRKPDFTPRGTAGSGGQAFWIYRLEKAGTPALVRDTIAAGDELAFAYANPAHKPYVMIFGVDEHRHVYWFHPAWPVGRAAPMAVGATAGPGPHELPEAIRHDLDGSQLDVYALFADTPLRVSDLEGQLAKGPNTTPFPPGDASVAIVRQRLAVRR